MSFDALMGRIGGLTAQAEALAAVAARLRADAEGMELDPAVEKALDRIVAVLDVDLDGLDAGQLGVAATTARTYLRQAAALADNPVVRPGWAPPDAETVIAQGKSSAVIARLLSSVAPQLDGLATALGRPGAAFLDVGSGVAAITIEMCSIWPELRVVGLEPWDTAMQLGRQNVAAAGLEDRVELRPVRIEELADTDAFDLVWLSGPFLRRDVVPTALEHARAALRPGGWAVFGLFAGAPDPLSQELLRLRVIRAGGHPFGPGEVEEVLEAAGFRNVHAVERTWHAPAAFVVGQR